MKKHIDKYDVEMFIFGIVDSLVFKILLVIAFSVLASLAGAWTAIWVLENFI